MSQLLKLDREIQVDEPGVTYGSVVAELVDHPAVTRVSFDRRSPSAMSDPRIAVWIDVDASMVEDLESLAALWGYSSWHQFLADEGTYLTWGW